MAKALFQVVPWFGNEPLTARLAPRSWEDLPAGSLEPHTLSCSWVSEFILKDFSPQLPYLQ